MSYCKILCYFCKRSIETIINNAIATQEWKRDELDSNTTYSCEIEYIFRNSAHGRADIILRNTKNVIVIENKIYAFDQKGQLAKYYKACRDLGYDDENIYILYLNRFGDDVSKYSLIQIKSIQYF